MDPHRWVAIEIEPLGGRKNWLLHLLSSLGPLFLLLPLWFASGKWGDGRDALGGRPGSVTLRLVVCKFCIKALLPLYLFSELNFSDRAVILGTQRPSRLYERTVPGSHKLPLNIPPPQLH